MAELVEIDPAALPTDTIGDREGSVMAIPPGAIEVMKVVILSIRPASRPHAVASIALSRANRTGKLGAFASSNSRSFAARQTSENRA